MLYLSPLRALAVDIDKNLRAPLTGIGLARGAARRRRAHADGGRAHGRHTSAAERRRLVTRPPRHRHHHARVAVPHADFSGARNAALGVRWVIVDEIHSVAATKRGHASGAVAGAVVRADRHEGRVASADRAGRPPSDRCRRRWPGSSAGKRSRPACVAPCRDHRCGQHDQAARGGGHRRCLRHGAIWRAASAGAAPNGTVRVDHDDDFALESPPPTLRDETAPSDTVPSDTAVGHGAVGRGVAAAVSAGSRDSLQQHLACHSSALARARVRAPQFTIIFTNARRLAERLASRLNELHLDGAEPCCGGRGHFASGGC